MATSPYVEGLAVRLAEAAIPTGAIAKRRFGRTEIQMPVLSCGGMRTQPGPHTEGMTTADIDTVAQANLDAIVKRALEFGINHFETARVYGCSELMYGTTLKKVVEEWGYTRRRNH